MTAPLPPKVQLCNFRHSTGFGTKGNRLRALAATCSSLDRLWNKGEQVEGVSRDVFLVGIEAYAKCLEDDIPYEFVNEYVCGALAAAIRLPVAHGVFVERDGKPCYASFNSYMSDGCPPPCIEPFARELIRKHPAIACGIVVFDVWTNNRDRHPRNVGYDRTKSTIHIFDHGEALIRGMDPTVHWSRNTETVEMQYHCIAKYINDEAMSHRDEWIERITNVPRPFIDRLFQEACRFGLTEDECRFGANWLINRASMLRELIDNNPQSFPSTSAILRRAGNGS